MNYIAVGVLLFVIVIIFLLGFGLSWKTKLWSTPSKAHLENIINNSFYFYRLNKYDLLARQMDSHESYVLKYKKSLKKFSIKESKILDRLIDIISTQYTNKHEKLQNIPWLIAKFENVENNFPHTIGDIIFLPTTFFTLSSSKQIETLIHEKVHIYQRLYPIETAKLISNLGFKVWGTQQAIKNIRSNPDTNSFIYSLNGTVQVQVYDSENPTNIAQSHTQIIVGDKAWDVPDSVVQRDHPYELLACAFAQLLIGSLSDHPMKNKFNMALL